MAFGLDVDLILLADNLLFCGPTCYGRYRCLYLYIYFYTVIAFLLTLRIKTTVCFEQKKLVMFWYVVECRLFDDV